MQSSPINHSTLKPSNPDPVLYLQQQQYKIIDEVVALSSTPNNALAYVTLSIATFMLTKVMLNKVVPKGARVQGSVSVWKWVNTANSLVHSVVTGVGAVVCAYNHPRIAINVISTYSDFSHKLTCLSVGYFLFDIYDMMAHHRKRSSYELIVHHIFVLSCFTLSITTRYYLSFTIISLIVEVNSIFLHSRQLLLITLTPKHSRLYRTTSLLNLSTFAVFRIATLGWMMRWMVLNKRLVNPGPYWLGIVSIVGLIVMSVVLFGRLVRADFYYQQGGKVFSGTDNNNSVGMVMRGKNK